MKVLNPSLYSALVSAFGDVKVANQGCGLVGRISVPYDGRPRVKITSPGEYYCVRCPHCDDDDRKRLWINHRWGTQFVGEYNGATMSLSLDHLVICYNENCEKQRGFRRWLKSVVAGNTGSVVYSEGVEESPELRPTSLPGVCTRLHKLPDYQAAVRYVREIRKFDPHELGYNWGVSWCEFTTRLPDDNKLIFPIYDYYNGQLAIMGWQARWLDARTLNDKPPTKNDKKYLFAYGANPKNYLYNGYRASKQHKIIVICEGVFDAMRVGRKYAVAAFGKSLSSRQKELLMEHWGSKGALGVVAFDPDARENVVEVMEWMKSWPGGAIALDYPAGQDPASVSQDYTWKMIRDKIRERKLHRL